MTELNFHFFFSRKDKGKGNTLDNNFSHFHTLMFQCWLFSLVARRQAEQLNALYDKSKLCIEKSKKIINQSMKINLTKIKGNFCTFAG